MKKCIFEKMRGCYGFLEMALYSLYLISLLLQNETAKVGLCPLLFMCMSNN